MFVEQQIMYVCQMATLSRVQKTQSASPFERASILKLVEWCMFTSWQIHAFSPSGQHHLEMSIWSSEALDLLLEAFSMFTVSAMSCTLGKCVRCACPLSGNTMYHQKVDVMCMFTIRQSKEITKGASPFYRGLYFKIGRVGHVQLMAMQCTITKQELIQRWSLSSQF